MYGGCEVQIAVCPQGGVPVLQAAFQIKPGVEVSARTFFFPPSQHEKNEDRPNGTNGMIFIILFSFTFLG